MKHLVKMFTDGSSVDFAELKALGLIEAGHTGYVLTALGKSYAVNN